MEILKPLSFTSSSLKSSLYFNYESGTIRERSGCPKGLPCPLWNSLTGCAYFSNSFTEESQPFSGVIGSCLL